MHENLEKRFVNLAAAESAFRIALGAFQSRYHLLFAALADERGWTIQELAKRVGFDPCPPEGNKITRGEAEAHDTDVIKLLAVYMEV
jgi:hypothetical protein